MFCLAHYAALALFVAACWGAGHALLSRAGPPPRGDHWLSAAMSTTLGLGLFICLFQALGIVGALKAPAVLAAVALGALAALLQWPAWRRSWLAWRVRTADDGPSAWGWADRIALVVLALIALPALFAPLAPPAAFDELMYHLPYARQVAQSGSLGVYEWLRYPWFPYNYNLLYAGALLVGDDVLPHFLGALAGWLSAAIVYRLAVLHTNRLTALMGAAIWIALGDYNSALIDMGVALFVLAACAALWWWREAPKDQSARWLALAAFFLGVAAGSKYQALIFLPLVAVFVIRHERRPGAWAIALLCFLLPSLYWYARNAITTGDPFNPIGASVFGFTNWTAADYKEQLYDVRIHAALPSPLLWAVLLAPFSPWVRRSAAVRAALVFCAYSLAVWLLTSRYPRYLMASFPLLSVMAALGWQVVFGWIAAAGRRLRPGASTNATGSAARDGARATGSASTVGAVHGAMGHAQPVAAPGAVVRWLWVALLAACAAVSVGQTARKIADISPTPAEREAFLRANVDGFAVMDYLRRHATGRVYQVALSQALYYGPNPIWGDSLGPWRYGDFITLPPAELARKLGGLGFEAIVITKALAPGLSSQPGFDDHFALMFEQDDARAYRILPHAP
ncbi:MAG: glycosyltransferase family 39 protein [Gammaproteobacteria bacterium]|nr:glycosyltransferase family 39 protein [Gammaproteobacteria bacterium]MBU1439804.1 glycosyltransferase family 39 protein [Gammaproteobacteria bacterium]